MQTMNQSLMTLYRSRKITKHDALSLTPEPEELHVMLEKSGL